jgi:hypothetical protein
MTPVPIRPRLRITGTYSGRPVAGRPVGGGFCFLQQRVSAAAEPVNTPAINTAKMTAIMTLRTGAILLHASSRG